jgi:TPR repeat protein
MKKKFSEHFLEALKREPDVPSLWRAVASLDQDTQEGLLALEELAAKGSILSMVYIGDTHENGRGVERDTEVGDMWYTRAADRGSIDAAFRLAFGYWHDGNQEKSIIELERICNLDFTPAAYLLGTFYYHGVGVEKSVSKAIKYFSMADKGGHLLARQDLSFILRKEKLGIKYKVLGWSKLTCLLFTGVWYRLTYPESDRFCGWEALNFEFR